MIIEKYLEEFCLSKRYIPAEINLNKDYLYSYTIFRLGSGGIGIDDLQSCVKKVELSYQKLIRFGLIGEDHKPLKHNIEAGKHLLNFIPLFDEKTIMYGSQLIPLNQRKNETKIQAIENALSQTMLLAPTDPNLPDKEIQKMGLEYIPSSKDFIYSELSILYLPLVLSQLDVIKQVIYDSIKFAETQDLIPNFTGSLHLRFKLKYLGIIKLAFALLVENGILEEPKFTVQHREPWRRIFSSSPEYRKAEFYRLIRFKGKHPVKSPVLQLLWHLYKLKIIETEREADLYKVASQTIKLKTGSSIRFSKSNMQDAKNAKTHRWLLHFLETDLPELKSEADRENLPSLQEYFK